MTTACSGFGEKESSFSPSAPENFREGAPDLLPDVPPDLYPAPGEEGVPYPYFPQLTSDREPAEQQERTHAPEKTPRPVRPAHPESSGKGAEKMPSPPARPKRGHRDAYRKDSDTEQGNCSSDCSPENCPECSDSAAPLSEPPRPAPRLTPRFKKS